MCPWGETVVEKTVGTGATAKTTRWSFYDQQTDGGSYMQLKETVDSNGSWKRYTYDDLGRQVKCVSQLGNQALGSQEELNRVSERYYNVENTAITILEKVKGREVNRRYLIFGNNYRKEINCPQPGASYSDPNNLVTETQYVPGSLPFKPAVVQNPDGSMEFYTYAANGTLIEVAQGQPKSVSEKAVSSHWDWNGWTRPAKIIREHLYEIS